MTGSSRQAQEASPRVLGQAERLTSLQRLTRLALVRLTATTLAPEACRAFAVSRPIPAGEHQAGSVPTRLGQGWGGAAQERAARGCWPEDAGLEIVGAKVRGPASRIQSREAQKAAPSYWVWARSLICHPESCINQVGDSVLSNMNL